MKKLTLAVLASGLLAALAAPADGLLPNPGFEEGDGTPADWPAANPAKGVTYETENGNRFARIHSDGGTAMLYREIAIPADADVETDAELEAEAEALEKTPLP